MTKEIPTGVKVISVLYYIGAVYILILGIFLSSLVPKLGALGAGISGFLSILLIGLAVLAFFIGKGLWKREKWARIAAIVLAVLGIISAINTIIEGGIGSGITILLIDIIIIAYLGFSSSVKKAFS